VSTKTLLNLSTLVEPDRQRLARFVMEAVRDLDGHLFPAVQALLGALAELRTAADAGHHASVVLECDGERLWLGWDEQRRELTRLRHDPAPEQIEALAERLRAASEATDPGLLRRRNRQIAAELELAQQRAAEEMAQLEQNLERKKEELRESVRLAETDSLTGLLNRGAYDERLRDALLRCTRQHESLSLILLDLDQFKAVNDTHGHQYGDAYLQRMAEAMRGAIRQHVDLACRTGGDEFAIIAFCPVSTAQDIGQRVLAAMEGRVSIGVAALHPEDTVDTLVGRADAALYEAKRAGRGRLVHATGPALEPSRAGTP